MSAAKCVQTSNITAVKGFGELDKSFTDYIQSRLPICYFLHMQ